MLFYYLSLLVIYSYVLSWWNKLLLYYHSFSLAAFLLPVYKFTCFWIASSIVLNQGFNFHIVGPQEDKNSMRYDYPLYRENSVFSVHSLTNNNNNHLFLTPTRVHGTFTQTFPTFQHFCHVAICHVAIFVIFISFIIHHNKQHTKRWQATTTKK